MVVCLWDVADLLAKDSKARRTLRGTVRTMTIRAQMAYRWARDLGTARTNLSMARVMACVCGPVR